MLILLGFALAAVGAAGSVWWGARGNTKVNVLQVARDVPFGTKVSADDFTTVSISLGNSVRAISADQEVSQIGKVAITHLMPGELLTSGELVDTLLPKPGQSIIAVPLKTTQIPFGLTAEHHVMLVPTPSATGAAAAAGGTAQTTPAPISGTVINVSSPDTSGLISVSVLVSTSDVATLEAQIGAGQLQLADAPASGS